MAKILITDDNRPFADNLGEILEDVGHTVVIAESGEAALSHVQQTRFDVLLSDMRMPEMGGAELVHRVRRLDPGLPAIVVTAFTNDNDLATARAEGLLAVLSKPLPIATLLHLVDVAQRHGLVALVEDDPQMSDNVTEVLRDAGFAAVTASSVLETQRLGDVSPFMALVDLRVPGGPDGAAMQTLAKRFPGLDMVVITAHGSAATPVQPYMVFGKPFQTSQLLAAVREIHQRKGQHHG